METQRNFTRSVLAVALVTLLLLMIPLVAMQFTDEVQWGAGDFIIMGLLIFTTGFAYVLLTRYTRNLIHRAAVAAAIGTTFLMIWANLAVGLIGDGPTPANLLYIGVIGIMIVGTVLSRFTAKGMERTLFGASLSLVVIGLVQFVTGMQHYPDSSVTEIVAVNAFFAVLFAISGLLFRYVALNQPSAGPEAH